MPGDTAYSNGPVRAEIAERDVDVLAPVPEGTIVEGRLGKHDFQIDLDAGTVTCPAEHTVAISTSSTGFRGANFTRATCADCPLKTACCPDARAVAGIGALVVTLGPRVQTLERFVRARCGVGGSDPPDALVRAFTSREQHVELKLVDAVAEALLRSLLGHAAERDADRLPRHAASAFGGHRQHADFLRRGHEAFGLLDELTAMAETVGVRWHARSREV